MIKILDTAFPEIKIVSREVFLDSRGDFSELFNQNEFPNFSPGGFAQANLSSSSMGVVRGMHWQVPPFQQGKLVSCLSGKVFDVAVDIRIKSKNFGKYISFNLEENDGQSIWIPEGFAHGFQVLSEQAKFHYLTSSNFSKGSARCLNPLDPDIGIDWPINHFNLSEADARSPKLIEVKEEDLFN
jgi:dTDP-4-dehydrorhamnose 3,5-epimerase